MSSSVVVLAVLLAVVFTIFGVFVLTSPPVRTADVKNGTLELRHYYDYRKDSPAKWYFAEMLDGKPTGNLYAVELRGRPDESSNRRVQFSQNNVRDFNSGTLVFTVSMDSVESRQYHESFREVLEKHRTQKWWERVISY